MTFPGAERRKDWESLSTFVNVCNSLRHRVYIRTGNLLFGDMDH